MTFKIIKQKQAKSTAGYLANNLPGLLKFRIRYLHRYKKDFTINLFLTLLNLLEHSIIKRLYSDQLICAGRSKKTNQKQSRLISCK